MSNLETSSKVKIASIVARDWWEQLQNKTGPRAILRRCSSILELALQPETHFLRKRLLELPGSKSSVDKAALIAGVLSWVETDVNTSIGAQLGQLSSGKSSIESRMRRLLREDWNNYDELLIQWRRMISLIGRTANAGTLAENLYWWNDKSKKEIASNFYENISHKSNDERKGD